MLYRKAVTSEKRGPTKTQERSLHVPSARLLHVLTGTILRLAPRRRMAPLDELNARLPATYTWCAVQAGMDRATCGACPSCCSVRE